MVDKNRLKEWFSNGKKPSQEHFWQWQDSYWHKEEKLSQDSIQDLSEHLQNKADNSLLQAHLYDADAHGIKDALAKKVPNEKFEEHLKDEDAHGIKDALAKKVPNKMFEEHLEDEDAHGIQYLCEDINFKELFEDELKK